MSYWRRRATFATSAEIAAGAKRMTAIKAMKATIRGEWVEGDLFYHRESPTKICRFIEFISIKERESEACGGWYVRFKVVGEPDYKNGNPRLHLTNGLYFVTAYERHRPLQQAA